MVSPVNNCNGLVCIWKEEREEIVIWNLFIIKYKKLPIALIQIPSRLHFIEHSHPKLAFGYDPVNDDYKVVRVVKFYKNRKISVFDKFKVKVYSLRAHSRKRVKDEWPLKNSTINIYRRPKVMSSASLNGVVHWLVTTGTAGVSHPQTTLVIVAFNLATEKFRAYKLPAQSMICSQSDHLDMLRGRIILCVCKSSLVQGKWYGRNEFWVMMEYGAESSWIRLCSIVDGEMPWKFNYCKPLLISEDRNRRMV